MWFSAKGKKATEAEKTVTEAVGSETWPQRQRDHEAACACAGAERSVIARARARTGEAEGARAWWKARARSGKSGR